MGIPSLFRWLNDRYPLVCKPALDMDDTNVDNKSCQTTDIFDNLYLDMNGIIHPCCHSDINSISNTEEEKFQDIFKYIDKLFGIVRPKALVYMAIDGVAPRAKMNQQRSRRFRTALDTKKKREINTNTGIKSEIDQFDSNCITPGTLFMSRLSEAIRFYIEKNINTNPMWKDIKVIFSDSSVPGEGEHKILEYIRRQRYNKDYNPNLKHVIYGADADLIMLSLITHEPYFFVLREDLIQEEILKKQSCYKCGISGHQANVCTTKQQEYKPRNMILVKKPFLFIHISILRECLYFELFRDLEQMNVKIDLERAIDDWIFLLFFVGNDFLPHLPSIEINEGAIDLLVNIYKEEFPNLNGYLTFDGSINLENVLKILEKVGEKEFQIFQKRRTKDLARINRIQCNTLDSKPKVIPKVENIENIVEKSNITKRSSMRHKLAESIDLGPIALINNQPTTLIDAKNQKNKNYSQKLRQIIQIDNTLNTKLTDEYPICNPENNDIAIDIENNKDDILEIKEAIDETKEIISVEECSKPLDFDVRLWEYDGKDRYYKFKFGNSYMLEDFPYQLIKAYITGLYWVMSYYYCGCSSWNWYYPYHYAPLASDFKLLFDFKKYETVNDNIESIIPAFELGEPFKPFEQLLGVLPSASRELLPKPYHNLMIDDNSDIIDFYPNDFKIDLNGKRFEWQGVALLPFVDEKRLKSASSKIIDLLTKDEILLNSFGNNLIFIHESSKLYNSVYSLYVEFYDDKLIPLTGYDINGFIKKDFNANLPGKIISFGDVEITNSYSHSAIFIDPFYDQTIKFSSILLEGFIFDILSITEEDFRNMKVRQRGRYNNSSYNPSVSNFMHNEYHKHKDLQAFFKVRISTRSTSTIHY